MDITSVRLDAHFRFLFFVYKNQVSRGLSDFTENNDNISTLNVF